MSQEFKLVPVEPGEKQQFSAAFKLCHEFGEVFVRKNEKFAMAVYREMLAAAPALPAGEEVDVLACASFAKNGNIQCWSLQRDHASLKKLEGEGHTVIELIDRKHFTALAAQLLDTVQRDARAVQAIPLEHCVAGWHSDYNDGLFATGDAVVTLYTHPDAGEIAAQVPPAGPQVEFDRLAHDQVLAICRGAAGRCTEQHSYMQGAATDAKNWLPHKWVIDAMRGLIGINVSTCGNLRDEIAARDERAAELEKALRDIKNYVDAGGEYLQTVAGIASTALSKGEPK